MQRKEMSSMIEAELLPKWAKKEKYMWQKLPYASKLTDTAMLLRDGDVMSTIVVEGIAADTLNDNVIDSLTNSFSNVVAQSGDKVSYYVHHISTPAKVGMQAINDGDFATQLDSKWQSHIKNANLREKRIYITVVVSPDNLLNVKILPDFFSRLTTETYKQKTNKKVKILNEIIKFLLSALQPANPRQLTFNDGEWLGLLATLTNGKFNNLTKGFGFNLIAETIPQERVTFRDSGLIVIGDSPEDHRYGAILGLKTYPGKTRAGMFNSLSLDIDTVVTHSYTPIRRINMLDSIRRVSKQMLSAEDVAESLRLQLDEAADDLESGRIMFGNHHLSIAFYSEQPSDIVNAIAFVKQIGQEAGATIVQEKFNAQPIWFAQHPGNAPFRSRKTTISTDNFADMTAFHSHPKGLNDKETPWGVAITTFPTLKNTPYRFSFHKQGKPDGEPTAGHTVILGKTGSGKTALAAFLMAQAKRAGARIFVIDKDHGMEMAVRALGGSYTTIRAGITPGINPFSAETDDRGKAWLTEWIISLIERDNPLNAIQTEAITNAVRQNADHGELQCFEHFVSHFDGVRDDADLMHRFTEWLPDGRYGWILDTDKPDRLNFDNELTAFDMTELLDLNVERTTILSYMFRRIERIIEDRRPALIIIDEAWKMLDDPYFVTKIKNWMNTFRKMNTSLVMLTQLASHLSESAAGRSIVENINTKILFPNDQAREEEYDILNLSDKEKEIATGNTAGARLAFVKTDAHALNINVDLSALGDLLTALGGGKSAVEKFGEDWRDRPQFWRDYK